jgi:hypothetical protein
VFKNGVLGNIFGPKREEVTTIDWRKLHNEELRDLYSLTNTIIMIRSISMGWKGHVASMEEKRNSYRAVEGKPEGKRQIGRPRTTWKDNIKMKLKVTE